jgi:hypothetical protein
MMKLPVEFYPSHVQLEIDSSRTVGIYEVGSKEVMGWVIGPADEIDLSASYTFEAEVDGDWYRWVGQRAILESPDRFVFRLRNGQPFKANKTGLKPE